MMGWVVNNKHQKKSSAKHQKKAILLEIESTIRIDKVFSPKTVDLLAQVNEQLLFEDQDLTEFSKGLVASCKEHAFKLHYIRSVLVSQKTLSGPYSIIQEYPLPDDVKSDMRETSSMTLEERAAFYDSLPKPCGLCPFTTRDLDALMRHHITTPHPELSKIIYVACEKSSHRLKLCSGVPFKAIDETGNTAAFEDGNLTRMGDEITAICRANNIKLRRVVRMYDPGLGLSFPAWWMTEGLEAGVFQEYDLPDDVKAE